jgi:hypothetical protein
MYLCSEEKSCPALAVSLRDAPTTALRQQRFHFIQVSLGCLKTTLAMAWMIMVLMLVFIVVTNWRWTCWRCWRIFCGRTHDVTLYP